MLRFDHMPSDFSPLFLFLGEAKDLAALAALLRGFAASPATIDVGAAIEGATSRSPVDLMPEEGEGGDYGLKPDGRGRFRWGLNAWQAEQIAGRIDQLTLSENRSGSEIFELGVPGEIPVKVSRGEFEDEFLIRKF